MRLFQASGSGPISLAKTVRCFAAALFPFSWSTSHKTMNPTTKTFAATLVGAAFLVSSSFAQSEAPVLTTPVADRCVECHEDETPGIVDHWRGSTHSALDVTCIDCHQANKTDADAWEHEGSIIATIVTPRDCAECHEDEADEFLHSHHAKAGRILHSLDNRLAEVAEGNREPFNPHGITPGREDFGIVNGLASAQSGCWQCHGSKVAFEGVDGTLVTVDQLAPDADGTPTNLAAVANIKRDASGKPMFDYGTWPNTGIGRKNFDGTDGSCTACHSRHDFSARRSRQPENCGKCHLGPDHPQKEVYNESKHGIAYRDMKDKMNLDSESWVLGVDYNAAPTCATCHMSGNKNNGGTITHDPGKRISWNNRPPASIVMDTINGAVIKESDPAKRRAIIEAAGDDFDSWQAKRNRMKDACHNCHSKGYVEGFYGQYDEFVNNYNQKFAKPGLKLMGALKTHKVRTGPMFDEEIEWIWFYIWHHEGRRARHGASMMAPDYSHWHGMFEVADRWYNEFMPLALEMCDEAEHHGNKAGADAVRQLIADIKARPEHQWADIETNKVKSGQKFDFDK
jgi:hypothetical protein